ncbi:hypothetical protein BXZ70DRAFT_1003264 [Cristinia sonorae]|uniref:Uncharacterized protein n=1 Tax=Cristinia sonorae TaxID=1940300 RepID=A0A8K0UYE0_9AGAR|nr:hypothetical protein BXZ70DRAFT_1003264 [Cristinia sonorae]
MSSAIRPRTSILDIFAVELVHMIKEAIPASDLRTHVCFYKAFPLVTPFIYGTQQRQAAFWESACLLSGLGLVEGETDPGEVDWKRVGFECVEKDGFCEHPGCGGALLDFNAEQTAKLGWSSDVSWKTLEIVRSNMGDEGEETASEEELSCIQDVECCRLFKYLRFERNSWGGAWYNAIAGHAVKDDAWLFYPARSKQTPRQQRLTRDHSLATRSFASFPVFSFIQVVFLPAPVSVANKWGVTVWDVQLEMKRGLDEDMTKKLTVFDLTDSLDITRAEEVERAFPPGTSLSAMLKSLRTRRGIQETFPLDGLEYDWYDEGYGPTFVVKINPRQVETA